MNKAILLSVKPKWVAKIFNGEKSLEIRKKFPKDYRGWVYIYCTKDKYQLVKPKDFDKYLLFTKGAIKHFKENSLNGKVVARFYCDVEEIEYRHGHFYFTEQEIKDREYRGVAAFKSCLTQDELHAYLQGKNGYAIHISDLHIFDKPKELNEFEIKVFPHRKFNLFTRYLTNAPQNFCYVEMSDSNA